MHLRYLAPALLSLFAAAACSSQTEEDESDEGAVAGDPRPVCVADATYPNAAMARLFPQDDQARKVGNYAGWPTADGSMPAEIVKARTKPEDARANLASRFGACSNDMEQHLESAKPNVYIYFSGYGDPKQNNYQTDEPAIMKWLNERDPKGIIFSVSWDCQNSGDSFCTANAQAVAPKTTSPEWKAFERSVRVIQGDGEAQKTMAGMKDVLRDQSGGYDAALSHAMKLGAQLVDQLLMADQGPNGEEKLGKIHLLGYSMGAHAASDILVQDFTADASTGYKWSRPGVCTGGGDTCTVAELKKVNWALGLGTPGWAEGLKEYVQAGAGRAEYELVKHGGLLRIQDPRFKNKLNVFNRRMDPTSTAEDTFQRGLGDALFGDYNHYSHDYSLPLFVQPGFVQVLDAFLEAKNAKSVTELGILYDNATLIDFDECKPGTACAARNHYLAHEQNRSHDRITLMETASVPTTDGVKRADRAESRAVSFTAQGAKAIVVPSMDQEDLRGGVELYYRPTAFDPRSPGADFGLFSYGKCQTGAGKGDLMPSAYLASDGALVFGMEYQGQRYEARTTAASAKLTRNEWTHLAFTWELPVESLTHPSNTDAELQRALPSMGPDLQKYKGALIWANGLRKPLATTFKRQKGQGTLRIFANGALAVEAPLGTPTSARDCLAATEVLPGGKYATGNDGSYSAYMPYANVTSAANSDVVAVNNSPIGTRCKAYKVRNVPVVFGCANANVPVNAGGDMDELVLVYGKGREKYENIGRDGTPKNWPVGATYDAKPFKAE